MIYTFIPYCPSADGGTNLGLAYNRCMGLIGEEDWACFIDHDAMFTTQNWYPTLERIAELKDDSIGLVTCVTNRIGNEEQLAFPKDSKEAQNHDVYFHRKIGMDFQFANSASLREAANDVSGVMMMTSKRVWRKVGGFKNGFLGVDHDYDRKVRAAGYKTYIADGLYVYHWYRAAPSINDHKPSGYDKKTFLPPV